ncbi:MAG: hypothetical protein M3Y66_03295 [Actinomycetota bacterium]|nr:hypothetical protein [Actinomycetota bacterium]
MRKPGLVALGAFLVVIGAVWFGQGIGWIGGSAMTGVTLWAVAGPVVALAGLSVIGLGLTRRSGGDDAGR